MDVGDRVECMVSNVGPTNTGRIKEIRGEDYWVVMEWPEVHVRARTLKFKREELFLCPPSYWWLWALVSLSVIVGVLFWMSVL